MLNWYLVLASTHNALGCGVQRHLCTKLLLPEMQMNINPCTVNRATFAPVLVRDSWAQTNLRLKIFVT